jgi:xylulokinase
MSLLGIDIGTTGCKVLALAADGSVLAIASDEYDVLRPEQGWAELDSRAVWNKVKAAIRAVAAQTKHDPVVALAVSSMGEALTPVAQDRSILGNAILGFDARGGETLDKLAQLDPTMLHERSGNLVNNLFGGPKLIWRRDHRPELFRQTYKFLGWADLAAFLLGGEPITDYSLANRTFFFDIRRQTWSTETLDYVGMPIDKLPVVAQAGTIVGTVSSNIAAELGLPANVKIVLGGHDQCVNATGAGAIRAGSAAYGIGTFACITPIYDTIPPAEMMIKARLNVEHHTMAGLYASFYYNLTAGALLKWFRDNFAPLERLQAQAQHVDVYDQLLAEMPAEPTDLLVLPHFAPTGPPYFDERPNGIITGLTLETTRGEYIKGLLEGITYYFREGLDVMGAAGIQIDELCVTGGGARSDAWMQITADILGKQLVRPKAVEASALGAAILAGVGAGVFSSAAEAVTAMIKTDRVFEPDARRHRLYAERFERYHQLYPFAQTIRNA